LKRKGEAIISRISSALCATLVAAAGSIAAPQDVSAGYLCDVKPTDDGFVALRAAPSPKGFVITRMRPGNAINLLHPPDYDDLVRSGSWLFVAYFPSVSDIPDEARDEAVRGWVAERLLDCGEE
jgi:hypothetical protein